VIAAVLALLALAPRLTSQTTPAEGYTFYVTPHSHIDVVWYWTYDQTTVMCIDIMKHALDMMRKDPRFTFTQDQMMAIKPFWDSLGPDDKTFLRRMVRERRFELASGNYLQPDEAEADFESLVRQFYPALSWMETTFSTKVSTAWNIDTYGHTVQMPQLFRKAGLKYFVFQRDVLPSLQASIKSPFYWEGPDGSRILSYWLSGSYSLDWRGISGNLRSFVDHCAPGNDKILLLYGGDVYVPKETTAEIEAKIREAAAKANIRVKNVVFCTPSQYFEKILSSGVTLPVYRNDFNPPLFIQDLRGLYGERPDSKMSNRKAEYVLESAEKFSSLAAQFGLSYPAASLHSGWLNVIFNQDHDALPGSHTDPVESDMMSRYGGAIEAGRAALADSLYRISRNIDTSRAERFPFLVFNPLSFSRTESVRYTPLFKEQITNFQLLDEAGNEIPFRTDFAGRRENGQPLSMAAIEFVAKDVPAMGYRLYQLAPRDGSIQVAQPIAVQGRISNRFFEIDLDPHTGAITSIVNRQTGAELINTSSYQGNELVLQEEKDPDMEGMLHFTGGEVRMRDFPATSITATHDGIGTRVSVSGGFLTGQRVQEIYLYDEIPRIDFRTRLLGFPGHDGVLAVVFPLRTGKSTVLNYETHNAVTTRPDGIYYAQTFVDAGDGQTGVGFFNRGMGGVETEQGVVRLILLRSITHYSGYFSPEASEAGSHTFEYSLYAHSGDWRNGVVNQAHSFTSPLMHLATDPHSGVLPGHHSFILVEEGSFEVTALKRSEDGKSWILRGHETMGRAGQVVLDLDQVPQQAWLSDLTERPIQRIPMQNKKIRISCKPFEFVTLRLDIKG
jgi:alpha-mannosidase